MILAVPLLAETGFAATLSGVFFYCAVIGGAVLVLQLVLMLMGVDDGGFGDVADAGMDLGDIDLDSAEASGFWFFEMLSLRTIAAAATFFGLVGKATLASGQSGGVALTLAVAAGYGAMYAVYWAFKQIFKLETSGNTDIRNAVGKVGQVYVPIDPGAAGKIQLHLQGRTVELQARTDAAERLATGAKVTVTEVVSSDTVKVAPATNPTNE